MEIMGFILGSIGMTFAIIAWEHINNLKLELDDLKKLLDESGLLKQKGKLQNEKIETDESENNSKFTDWYCTTFCRSNAYFQLLLG